MRRALLSLLFGIILGAAAHAYAPWQPVIAIPCCHTTPFSTWDPAVNSTACPPSPTTCITYTNSNLTWTGTDCVGIYCLARGTNNHTNGKWHVEFAITNGGGCCQTVGLTSSITTANQQQDQSAQGVAYGDTNGLVTGGSFAFPLASGMPTWTTGNTVCMEVDITNKLVWFSLNGGTTWYGAGGTPGTPSTGTNGINFASIVNFNLYPGANAGFTNTNSYTLNVGASSFGCTVSSGFLPWG